MVENFFDQIVVKIVYKRNYGSGVLISNRENNTLYMISAWHCFLKEQSLEKQEIHIYRQMNNEMKELSIDIIETIIDENNDIIIFDIKYISNLPYYQIMNLKESDSVSIVGFPFSLSGDICKTHRYNLNSTVNSFPDNSKIILDCNRPLETYESTAKDNVSGYSGCGIFSKRNDSYFLHGIITNLGSPQGTFGFVQGVQIDTINKFLYSKKSKNLTNALFSSFNIYKENTLSIFDDGALNNICSVQVSNIIKHITPESIVKHCGNKIVWPYSDELIHKNEVWEEWLLYLIVRSIECKDNIKNEGFYMIKKNNNNRKVKVLYTSQYTRLADFLKNYLTKAYEDISKGQVMILQTNNLPATLKLSEKIIENIVSNISSPIANKHDIYIDDVASQVKTMSVIHIRKFVDEMTQFIEMHENDGLTVKDLEEKLSDKIREVLYGI